MANSEFQFSTVQSRNFQTVLAEGRQTNNRMEWSSVINRHLSSLIVLTLPRAFKAKSKTQHPRHLSGIICTLRKTGSKSPIFSKYKERCDQHLRTHVSIWRYLCFETWPYSLNPSEAILCSFASPLLLDSTTLPALHSFRSQVLQKP
jgi:hypothetical protein